MPVIKVAAVQQTSTEEVSRNLEVSERLIRESAAAGASFVALPENFAYMKVEGEVAAFSTSIEGEVVARMSEVHSPEDFKRVLAETRKTAAV